MDPALLQNRLSQELGPINEALMGALDELPAPSRPVAAHIIESGGKRLRPFLTVICGRMFGAASDDIYRLAGSMEMLHAATLLHDDILDCAASRRGRPAAHTVYGQPAAILAGDALLAMGNAVVAEFNMTALTACYSLATIQTAAGEIMEMSTLRQPDLPHEEYVAIARGKTGCLIAQACALGALYARAPEECIKNCLEFGENLGLAFQIVDDALDFSPQGQTGKPSGGDLREGKMTPPLRLYRQSLNAEDRLVFDEKFIHGKFTGTDVDRISKAALPYALQSLSLADQCLDKARLALAVLPDTEERQILLAMTDYVRNRHS